MSKIKKVENQPNFPQLEDKINKFWAENKIFKKSVEERPESSIYRFIDGPPFVSGSPHYGHLLASLAKDVIPRYQTMKGKRVRRVWGWDCHGLAVENKVNQKLGIKSSKQLEEEFGIENYIKECRNYIATTSNDWNWYVNKIGRWVDMDNAYYTMSPEFMESVIWGFKQMYDKGFIYKGKRVSLFSTDTSTPVSNFEVAMDADNYQDVEDLSIFVKFKLLDLQENGKDVYLTAWTTTPWTIPSNFALAVNPNEDYCFVKFEEEFYIVAKKRLTYTFQTEEENIGNDESKLVKIIREFKGTELEGERYEPVYDFFTNQKKENDFKVYLYEGVTTEDGTGVLHVAPAFGEEDFNLGKKFNLSDHSDIDEAGKLIVGEWKGIYLRNACESITENLQQKGNLLRSELYTHRLPFYRGENPLIYMAQDSYFINVQKIKCRMLELNQDINWMPEFIKEGRFAQTLETSPDWAVSRNRYWATIMPVWRSENGEEIVLGSFEEMMQYTDQVVKKEIEGKKKYFFVTNPKSYTESNNNEFLVPMTLHRDICDKLVLVKEGKEFYRIPEVLDCWMDSGSVPFAEYHYPFENKELYESHSSADYIIEYIGQVRAWFNVVLRVSTLLFDESAFKNVICTGVLAGNDGRKMSKTYGNYPDPKHVLENMGAESLRLYLMGSPIMMGGDMNWSDELLREQQKNILIPLWNTYKYFSIYAELHNFDPESTEFNSTNILDKWLKNFMDKTTLEYSKALESYDIPSSVKLIQPAIDNISSWWIRRSRDRFVSGDKEALQTLYSILVQFIKTFAPQMPFVTEEIYQNLVVGVGIKEAKESIHLEFYPELNLENIDDNLLDEMNLIREVCSLGLSIRVENSLKVRQPLSEVKIASEKISNLNPELIEIIKDELNVKSVTFGTTENNVNGRIIKSNNDIVVNLDSTLTDDLKEEGLLNEILRQLQNFRKVSGLQMGQIAAINYFTENSELKNVVEKNLDQIKRTVGLSELAFVENLEGKVIKIENKDFFAKIV